MMLDDVRRSAIEGAADLDRLLETLDGLSMDDLKGVRVPVFSEDVPTDTTFLVDVSCPGELENVDIVSYDPDNLILWHPYDEEFKLFERNEYEEWTFNVQCPFCGELNLWGREHCQHLICVDNGDELFFENAAAESFVRNIMEKQGGKDIALSKEEHGWEDGEEDEDNVRPVFIEEVFPGLEIRETSYTAPHHGGWRFTHAFHPNPADIFKEKE